MSPKGRGKAMSPVDSDSDSDIEFFTVKRKPPPKVIAKPLAKPAPPPIVMESSEPEYDSITDSDEPHAKRKHKRRKTKADEVLPTPIWMEIATAGTAKHRGSSRSTSREVSRSKTAVINMDEERENELEKEKRRRARIVAAITPPPELPMEENLKIRRIIAVQFGDSPAKKDNEEDGGPSSPGHGGATTSARASSPATDFEPDERVTINIHMVADPDKRRAGISEKALARYEKPWAMFVNRRDPLSRMLSDLAGKIGKDPKDIIAEYSGAKLYSSLTPIRLGIQANQEVEMLGYESAIYEKILAQRAEDRAKRMAELEGGSAPGAGARGGGSDDNHDEGADEGGEGGGGDDDGGEGGIGAMGAVDEEAPVAAEKKGTILKLRGTWGELLMRVPDNITIKILAAHYCKKHDRAGEEDSIKLEFDGETLELETSIGDLGVEDRDILDVICPP